MPPHAVLSSCVGYLLTALTAAKPATFLHSAAHPGSVLGTAAPAEEAGC